MDMIRGITQDRPTELYYLFTYGLHIDRTAADIASDTWHLVARRLVHPVFAEAWGRDPPFRGDQSNCKCKSLRELVSVACARCGVGETAGHGSHGVCAV